MNSKPGALSNYCFNYSNYIEENIGKSNPNTVQYSLDIEQEDFFTFENVLHEFSNLIIKDPSLSSYNIKAGWAEDSAGLWFEIKI